jgi:D-alanine-D-alanine ligase
MKRLLEIAVVCGGPSSEHEVSLNTANMVLKNLDRKKYRPSIVVIRKDGLWAFNAGKVASIGEALQKLKTFDFIFIAMHGAFGEDGRFQAILEWIGVPYSGSGVLSSAMAMNKQVSNVLYETSRMNVPRYVVINKNAEKNLSLPVVIKPAEGGSSVGVSIVKSKKDLRTGLAKAFRESDRVMIQQYIKGREFTCGVLEGKNGKPFALPPTEIIPKSSSFFDYRAKYRVGGSLEITPAQLPKAQAKELQHMAVQAHVLLGCRGMSRSDFMLKGSMFYILETNTIPGMTETSLLPQAARAAGMSFTTMLDVIVKAGLRRK